MTRLFPITLAVAISACCRGQALSPAGTLERYLSAPPDLQTGCRETPLAVEIEAALPKLKKRGTMSGVRLVSRTGQIIYHGLRFSGDNFIKTSVIARFLASESTPQEQNLDVSLSHGNYSFTYLKTADYNGTPAQVFRIAPRRKRVGLIKGELWLNAETAEPLRLWGDFVKSPSIFLRSLRIVVDYQSDSHCSEPLRMLVTIGTRLAGDAQIVEWLHPMKEDKLAAERPGGQ